jgi:D-alanine-D-alanine ligase
VGSLEGRPLQVAILAGGLSPERDVSLRSGRRVADALRAAEPDWEVAEFDVDSRMFENLQALRPDAVLPLLHGAAGEDGALRDILRALDLPFIGTLAHHSRLAFDKAIAKSLLEAAGLCTPKAMALPQSTFRDIGTSDILEVTAHTIGLPLIVKPTRSGSALGTSIVRNSDDFPAALVSAFSYGDVVLIEACVSGTEVAVSVLETAEGTMSLPVVEIVPPRQVYDYHARYTAGTTEFFVPARLTESLQAACAEAALTAHRVLGLRDWSRTDLMVDEAGTIWFLETNVAPGMTETSLYPQALAAAGLGVGPTLAWLIRRSVDRRT